MYLGNLSARQMCERLGIEFTEEIAKMEEFREQVCDKVEGRYVWHCYDIPLFLQAGTEDMGRKWFDLLSPYSAQMKDTIQIGGWIK